MDSSVFLGADSSYSISIDDHVFLEKWKEVDSVDSRKETSNGAGVSKPVDDDLTEYVIELQVNIASKMSVTHYISICLFQFIIIFLTSDLLLCVSFMGLIRLKEIKI